jgi:hypothetical protein
MQLGGTDYPIEAAEFDGICKAAIPPCGNEFHLH